MLSTSETAALVSNVRRAMCKGTDGPVTPFVLMVRACELSKEHDAELVANVLHEELLELGALRDEEQGSCRNTAD